MFIRVKRRQLATLKETGFVRYNLDFSLVRSVRIDGRPRQQIVAYLGTCADFSSDSPDMVLEREAFYERMLPILQNHGFDCSEENLHEVTKRVPRPSRVSVKKAAAAKEAMFVSFRRF